MATNITLDDIRAAAEAKYGSTDIAISEDVTVRLLNPLRLPKAKRDALGALQGKLGEDDADQEALLSEAILVVAESEAKGKKLLSALGGDLALLAQVFETYSDGTQVGEASPSAS
ncbi:phage tail assembly protein [Actinoplanes sp. NPDC026670]|uniref:phage tail assembly protein n=1 Tax=Actinoplanes sp. NPDC026670 TaxID=3154700 RepID=UPI0033C3FA7D